MPKYYRRKKTFRRKRRYFKKKGGKSSKFARRQQRSAFTYTKKKYTKVFVCEVPAQADNYSLTISHFGGRNNQTPLGSITMPDCGQDNQLAEDMNIHQYFKIRGVAWKFIAAPPTDTLNTPVQWSCAYSATKVIAPTLDTSKVQTLATYQTGGADPTKPISRYFKTGKAISRMGVNWADCSTYQQLAANPPVINYNGQLPVDQGSSTLFRVFRKRPVLTQTAGTIGRIEVTYYVIYKGQKGQSSITVQ